MGHWRLRSVWWTLGLGVVVLALLLGAPTVGTAEQDPDGDDLDFPCEGLQGICLGLCVAAEIAQCDENPDSIVCRLLKRRMKVHQCTEPPPVKRVFVTSTTYTGNLGGLAGADAKCQERATAAGLSGTFKAWLSAAGTGNSAAERLTPATVPYVRVDGAQVAANFTDLVDGLLAAPISLDEFGAPFVLNTVWTGTRPDGSSAPDTCASWTDDSFPSINQGEIGRPGATGATWTSGETRGCGGVILRPIYCIEQ
jgi:Protein of unknown function (DUF1554)